MPKRRPVSVEDVVLPLLGFSTGRRSLLFDFANLSGDHRASIAEHRILLKDASCVASMKIYRSIVNSLVPKWDEPKASIRRAWKNYIDNEWRTANFQSTTNQIADAFLWGYHPAQLVWRLDSDGWRRIERVEPLRPEWFSFDDDENLVLNVSNGKLKTLPKSAWICAWNEREFANPYGFRECEALFFPVIFKREALKMFAIAGERFGVGGFLEGVMTNQRFYQDDSSVSEFFERLKTMLKDGVVVRPQDQDVKWTSFNGVVDGRIYASLINVCNKEIAKTYLGHYLQLETETGGSIATKEAIEQGNKMVTNTRSEMIISFWHQHRDQFFRYNYAANEQEFQKIRRDLPSLNLRPSDDSNIAFAQRDAYLIRLGFRPKKSYIAKTYQIQEDLFDLAPIDDPDPTGANNPNSQPEATLSIDEDDGVKGIDNAIK